MADFPFHVAGGLFQASKPGIGTIPHPLISLETYASNATELRQNSSRRRKLWEIPHKFHCPVIGVCFGCDDLRMLMGKVMHLPRETSDFVLHTTAVGNCEERTPLAELLHKTLEKRYQLIIRKLAAIKSNSDLRQTWQQACKEATQIPGTLWAVWTHPACDTKLEQDVYGDIHMIQHQIGAGTRADVHHLHRLETDKSHLKKELTRLRGELDALRHEKTESVQSLKQQLTHLRSELAAKDTWGQSLHHELLSLSSKIPDLADREELARQRDEVWEQNARLKAERLEQNKELTRLRAFSQHAEEILESFAHGDEAQHILPATNLAGKCVLCVGGRSGAVTSYRAIVEQSGGRFLHHDGGLEESLHRIDGALASADIVICQAGCISHNAYWRVKDLCKRTGKACMFVKSSGVASFGKAISDIAQPETGSCNSTAQGAIMS